MNGFVKADICRQVSVCLHVFCGILFALKPFCDYSLCLVWMLPKPAFYSQSVVRILYSVCTLPLVRSPQSAFYTDRFSNTTSFQQNATALPQPPHCNTAHCLWGHRFESCRGFRLFLCPMLVTCWSFHFHITASILPILVQYNISTNAPYGLPLNGLCQWSLVIRVRKLSESSLRSVFPVYSRLLEPSLSEI